MQSGKREGIEKNAMGIFIIYNRLASCSSVAGRRVSVLFLFRRFVSAHHKSNHVSEANNSPCTWPEYPPMSFLFSYHSSTPHFIFLYLTVLWILGESKILTAYRERSTIEKLANILVFSVASKQHLNYKPFNNLIVFLLFIYVFSFSTVFYFRLPYYTRIFNQQI